MNVYEQVTERIIAALDNGIIPWRKEWKATGEGCRIPSNHLTGRMYRGINIWLLSCAPYSSQSWMTYKQAQEAGGQVRKGEKGWPVVFWKFDESKDAQTGEKSKMVLTRNYTVFNVEQIDGLPQSLPFESQPFDAIAAADEVVRNYFQANGAPALHHAGGAAYYHPSRDEVVMPDPQTFNTSESYYAVLFHEATHSTGHPKRLKRDFTGHTGDANYSKEELVAEFGSAFLCARAGISNERLENNSAAYSQGWLRALKNDKTLALQSAQRAQRAADYILRESIADAESVAA